jgi:hypothetical protein
MEAYICANEALTTNPTHRLATTLINHALYTIHPKKRLLDNADRLHQDYLARSGCDRDLELLIQEAKWHHTADRMRFLALFCQRRER